MFAYIAASPFVFIEQLGLSPRQFAIVFGCNAFALIGNSQLNRLRLRRSTPAQILGRQLYVTAGAAIAIAALAWTGRDVVAAARRRAVRLRRHHRRGRPEHHRGGARPLRRGRRIRRRRCSGSLQFGLAALAGIAVGTWHDGTARPLGTVVLVCGLAAWVCGTLATANTAPFRRS